MKNKIVDFEKFNQINELFDDDNLRDIHEIDWISGKMDVEKMVKNYHPINTIDSRLTKIITNVPLLIGFSEIELVASDDMIKGLGVINSSTFVVIIFDFIHEDKGAYKYTIEYKTPSTINTDFIYKIYRTAFSYDEMIEYLKFDLNKILSNKDYSKIQMANLN